MPTLRAAIRARQKLRLVYRAKAGALSERVVRPLHMEFWGRIWTMTAWCELRDDFRVFRVDLIERAEALPELFAIEPGKSMADYLARMETDGAV
jgi:predicted DNA-binding transcriptional regulator YafY